MKKRLFCLAVFLLASVMLLVEVNMATATGSNLKSTTAGANGSVLATDSGKTPTRSHASLRFNAQGGVWDSAPTLYIENDENLIAYYCYSYRSWYYTNSKDGMPEYHREDHHDDIIHELGGGRTVTLVPNGPSGGGEEYTLSDEDAFYLCANSTFGTKIYVPAPNPKYEDVEADFVHWYKESNIDINYYDRGERFCGSDEHGNFFRLTDFYTTLKAKWSSPEAGLKANVSFRPLGGAWTENPTITIVPDRRNMNATRTITLLPKEGSTNEWYVSDDDLKYFTVNSTVIYAPGVDPVNPGKKFMHWYYGNENDDPASTTNFFDKDGKAYYNTTMMTFRAAWDVDTEYASIVANLGTIYNVKYFFPQRFTTAGWVYYVSNGFSLQRIRLGSTQTVQLPDLSGVTYTDSNVTLKTGGKARYDAAGWFDENGNEVTDITLDGTTNLYNLFIKWQAVGQVRYWLHDSGYTMGAKWTPSDPDVTLDRKVELDSDQSLDTVGPCYYDSGKLYGNGTQNVYSKYSTISIPNGVPVRPGYTFLYWENMDADLDASGNPIQRHPGNTGVPFGYAGVWKDLYDSNPLSRDYQTYHARWQENEANFVYQVAEGQSDRGQVNNDKETVMAASWLVNGAEEDFAGAQATANEGYVFTGWTVTWERSDGTIKQSTFSGKNITAADIIARYKVANREYRDYYDGTVTFTANFVSESEYDGSNPGPDSSDNPSGSTGAPSGSTGNPSDSTANPSDSTGNPSDSTGNPSGSTDNGTGSGSGSNPSDSTDNGTGSGSEIESPATGDDTLIALYVAVAVISLSLLVALAVMSVKRRSL